MKVLHFHKCQHDIDFCYSLDVTMHYRYHQHSCNSCILRHKNLRFYDLSSQSFISSGVKLSIYKGNSKSSSNICPHLI